MSESNGSIELSDPPSSLKPETPDYTELGVSGRSSYLGYDNRQFNPKLLGKRGIETFDVMRKTDGQVRATMRLVKSPLLSAQWFVQPFSNEQVDLDAAEAVNWALFHGMSRTWIQVLFEALLMLDFGWYGFEKVWKPVKWRPNRPGANTRLLQTWKKFAPRHPRHHEEWKFDANGGIVGWWHRNDTHPNGRVFIPIEKALIFTHDEEANDPEGVSILRSAYIHYFIKHGLYKVDAIQKERHAIGIPKTTLPPNASAQDKQFANELGRNIRTNEKAFLSLPFGYNFEFVKLEGQLVNVIESVDHHNHQISNNVLASFLDLGASQSGSRAVGDVQSDIFLKALRYLGDLVRGVVNHYAIPEFVNYNFLGVNGYPELRVRRIGENVDNRALSVALGNLAKFGLVTPEPQLEEFIRNVYDLPAAPDEALNRTAEDRIAVKNIKGLEPVDTPPPAI